MATSASRHWKPGATTALRPQRLRSSHETCRQPGRSRCGALARTTLHHCGLRRSSVSWRSGDTGMWSSIAQASRCLIRVRRCLMAIPIQVTFDCADPARVASFWAKALGYKLQDPPEGYASWPDFLTAIGVPEADWKKASAIVDRDAERDASAIQRWKANQDVVMRKVLVIGSGGAGRSTFAATLS